ncbi:MAG: geranyl transferase, partial [Butyricicoccus sp.]|nr:geranyl transferase [Butyricicoccus sp.]
FGKPIGSDAASGKSTFPELLGADKCRRMIRNLTDDAIGALDAFTDTDFLAELAESLVSRKR